MATGLKVPFQRDGKGDFAQVEGNELESASLDMLLTTNSISAKSKGDIPWRQEFGASLDRLRHQRNTTALSEIAKSRIATQIGRWMPQLELLSVDTRREGTALRIQVRVKRRNTSAPLISRHR